MFGDSECDWRNDASCCDLVVLDESESDGEIEFGDDDHGSSIEEGQVHNNLQTEDAVIQSYESADVREELQVHYRETRRSSDVLVERKTG